MIEEINTKVQSNQKKQYESPAMKIRSYVFFTRFSLFYTGSSVLPLLNMFFGACQDDTE